MLRVLKQLLLTTMFVVFASQASAMFIQPDWFDPTEPGVGTNRYAYSHNDPVNKLDPGGNEAITATGIGLGFVGLVVLEYTTDVINDGELNGNGLIGGGIQGVVNVLETVVEGVLVGDTVHSEENPFGIDLHGGKAGIDLPTPRDLAGAPTEEIEGYIDLIGESIEQRERELSSNPWGLSPKEQKGHRTKLSNEKKSKEQAEAELGLRGALEGGEERDRESESEHDTDDE